MSKIRVQTHYNGRIIDQHENSKVLDRIEAEIKKK